MNRKPFNRSGFNRPGATQETGNSGIALLKLDAIPVFANREIIIPETVSIMALLSAGVGTNTKYGIASALFSLGGSAVLTKYIEGNAEPATMELKTQANQSVQGEAVIDLEGLSLAPGDELIINTCDMTVVLNGQNGTQYFSPSSEFFALLSGENEIIYADENESREINLDVIWKDRWL